jgi:hypothetical protein
VEITWLRPLGCTQIQKKKPKTLDTTTDGNVEITWLRPLGCTRIQKKNQRLWDAMGHPSAAQINCA